MYNVNIRIIQTCREFFMSLLEPSWWHMPGGKISTDWGNALEKGSFTAYFIHENQKRRRMETYMKSTGGGLRGQEKNSRETSRLDTRQNWKTHTSFTPVGTGELITNIYCREMALREQDNNEGFCGLLLCCWRLCLWGVEKENHSDILKICHPRCIRTMDSAHLR